MHAVVAIRKAEVDVASAELHLCRFVHLLVVCLDDGRVIDGLSIHVFQHTALLPHLIHACQHRHVVECHRVRAVVGKNQQSRLAVEQSLDGALESLYVVQHHPFRFSVGNEVGEVLILFLRNVKQRRHGEEHGVVSRFVTFAELHHTQQQQRFLPGLNLAMQRGADESHSLFAVEIVGHFVCQTHVAVKVEVEVGVSDAEVPA